MGWLIALGILLLLAVLPLGGRVYYDSDGIKAWVLAGPIRIAVFPRKKKEKKKDKKPDKPVAQEKEENLPKQPDPPPSESKKEQKKEKGGSLLDFLPLVRVALDMLNSFRSKIRIDNLYVRLILASGDPADLGETYAKTWTALANLMPRLERVLRIKKRDIQLGCDFEASETLIILRLDLTITLGRLLALGTVYGLRALKEFLKLKKKRKGGAKNESKAS